MTYGKAVPVFPNFDHNFTRFDFNVSMSDLEYLTIMPLMPSYKEKVLPRCLKELGSADLFESEVDEIANQY